MMQASRLLARFKVRREAIVLVPYSDSSGLSIGCGHYLGDGQKGLFHPPITIRQAFDLLQQDIREREPIVNRSLKVPVEQHQFDCLLDLLFQGGSDGLAAVSKIINKRDPRDAESIHDSDRAAAQEILNWDVNAAGEDLSGLLKRSGRRVAMFLAGEYGSDLDVIPLWRVWPGKAEQYRLQPGDLP